MNMEDYPNWGEEVAKLNRVIVDQAKEISQLKTELVGTLEESIRQSCIYNILTDEYDSMAVLVNAEHMRRLAELGRFEIITERGRRVIGRFVRSETDADRATETSS